MPRPTNRLADPLVVYLGLPLEALSEEAGAVADGVRRWLVGDAGLAGRRPIAQRHGRGGQDHLAGGRRLFDYLLDDAGAFIPARKAHFDKEIGVISVGMNTVELLVTRSGAPQDRFTAGRTAGVRRLLDLVNPGGLYSLGELDTQLRAGKLDTAAALPVWEREVISFVERRWGNAYKRFAAVIVVGGGALLLRSSLLARFNAKAYMPDDPVLSTARAVQAGGDDRGQTAELTMTQRGRPRLPVQAVVLNLKLRLRPGVDDDLIAFFGQIPPRHRAGAAKAAMRSGNLATAVSADLPADEAVADALGGAVAVMAGRACLPC